MRSQIFKLNDNSLASQSEGWKVAVNAGLNATTQLIYDHSSTVCYDFLLDGRRWGFMLSHFRSLCYMLATNRREVPAPGMRVHMTLAAEKTVPRTT